METRGKVRKIIIDCDPGHDDAIAILLAGASPHVDLIGITTVAGNAEVEKTTVNALKVCEIAGLRDVPVSSGAGRPLVRGRETAADIHGDSGMDGPVLPEPTKPATGEHAVDYLVRTLLASDEEITLVPVGPLTNIALAMRKEPAILPRIREIVLMGGGTFGNWTPAAEFNIYVDAEAARIVFESGVPLTMFGLDLTHKALATPAIQERVKRVGNPVSDFVAELLQFFMQTYKDVFGMSGAPIHDACCVVYAIDPSVFTCRKLRVDIETKGEFTYGMTVVDTLGVTGREPNVNVAWELDMDRFWELVVNTLSNYSKMR